MKKLIASFVLAACLIGCNQDASPTSNGTPTTNYDKTGNSIEIAGDWEKHIGTKVTVTGKALNRKIGAYVQTRREGIYVDLPQTHWPNDLYFGGDNGETITVTGTVVERNDLPVFAPDPNRLPIQGVPVPQGTNLEDASKRYILESVSWQKTGSGG